MLSPVPYYGSKARVASDIVDSFPAHSRYVEPFAGSLSILLAKAPSRHEVVNDLDGDLMTFWRVLRDRPEDLARACRLTPHSRAERVLARERPPELDDLERARRVWSALAQGRHGTLRNTGWRHDLVNAAHTVPRRLASYVARMERTSERLRSVTLECRPALEVVTTYGRDPDTLLYVDPPYLGSTRTPNYAAEMSGRADHRELAEALGQCRASVIVSGYDSPLYAELFGAWFRRELDASTTQGLGPQRRVEILWSNREFRHDGASDSGSGDETPTCGQCGRIIAPRRTGRPPTWCSAACRTAAWRERRTGTALVPTPPDG